MNLIRRLFQLLLCLCSTTAALAQSSAWSQFAKSPGRSDVRHDDIYFTDPTNGWAIQNNDIYRTTNGGATWTTNLTLSGTHFRSIAFATPKIGFAGNLGPGSYDSAVNNSNVLYRSFDGGITWSNVPGFAEVGMKGLCSIFVLDSQHIYGAGRVQGPAYVIKSSNGGTNWTTINLTAMGVMNAIMDIYFHDPMNGWVVGMSTNSFTSPPYYGRIARTSDGGNTWVPVVTATIANTYFWKISWPTTNVGYVTLQQNTGYTDMVYYKTTNGGNNWISRNIPLTSVGRPVSSFYLQGIGFISENEGWIGGTSVAPYSSSFLRTTNGGTTWQSAGYSNSYSINRIRFLNSAQGFASGSTLHFYSAPLAITNQPKGLTVLRGTNVTLSVGASGNSPISYQWRKDGSNWPGANGPTITLNNVTRLESGAYSVVLTNAGGSLQSSNALVHIMVPERLNQPFLLPGGGLQLLIDDADGGALLTTNDIPHFEVYASTNLVNWTVITNALTITNGSLLLRDNVTNFAKRYYRVLEK